MILHVTYSVSIPSNPSQLYGSTLSNGAFIQNNSWTLNTNTYHAICASLDSFVFSNPNLVLVFAAGNLENDKESIDRQYTVTCPGIAKNVITGELIYLRVFYFPKLY